MATAYETELSNMTGEQLARRIQDSIRKLDLDIARLEREIHELDEIACEVADVASALVSYERKYGKRS